MIYLSRNPVSCSWILIAAFLIVCSNALCRTSSRQRHRRVHRHQAPSFCFHSSIPSVTSVETVSTNTDFSEFASSKRRFQFFLRCSPLIGGPSFLPLHVEVILIPALESITDVEHSNEATLNRASNESFDAHRFDFLPENPKEPATIVRLLQLQPVPGQVRYRRFPALNTGDSSPGSTPFQLDKRGNIVNQQEDRGITILLRLGVSSSRNDSMSKSVLTTAVEFINSYRTTYGSELRILGGKNCLSFALDMISHIDDAHGIDIKLSLPKMI